MADKICAIIQSIPPTGGITNVRIKGETSMAKLNRRNRLVVLWVENETDPVRLVWNVQQIRQFGIKCKIVAKLKQLDLRHAPRMLADVVADVRPQTEEQVLVLDGDDFHALDKAQAFWG